MEGNLPRRNLQIALCILWVNTKTSDITDDKCLPQILYHLPGKHPWWEMQNWIAEAEEAEGSAVTSKTPI